VGYFHNVPAEYIYRDPYLTEKVLFESILAECDGNPLSGAEKSVESQPEKTVTRENSI
jgi:hypothetical protein